MNLEEKAKELIDEKLEKIKVELIAKAITRIRQHEREIDLERKYVQTIINEPNIRWNDRVGDWELGR